MLLSSSSQTKWNSNSRSTISPLLIGFLPPWTTCLFRIFLWKRHIPSPQIPTTLLHLVWTTIVQPSNMLKGSQLKHHFMLCKTLLIIRPLDAMMEWILTVNEPTLHVWLGQKCACLNGFACLCNPPYTLVNMSRLIAHNCLSIWNSNWHTKAAMNIECWLAWQPQGTELRLTPHCMTQQPHLMIFINMHILHETHGFICYIFCTTPHIYWWHCPIPKVVPTYQGVPLFRDIATI